MSYDERKAQADALKIKIKPLLKSNSLANCDICAVVNPTKNNKYCVDCFLLEMGLVEKVPFITSSQSKNPEEFAQQEKMIEGIKKKNLLVASLASQCNEMFTGACCVALQEQKSKEDLQNKNDIMLEESTKLYDERNAFEEKFKKLGRPSGFKERFDLYNKHYLGVTNPPSYNQLSKIIGISRQQVIRDLKRMGVYKKSLDKQ